MSPAKADQESMFACRAGACYRDEVARVEQQLHDELIAANRVRLGPVRWLEYDTSDKREVASIIERIGFGGTDMLRWITLHPGCTLVVAMVEVPAP